MAKKKVLFVAPYPIGNAPSQRFRVEAYYGLLDRNDIAYDTEVFLDEKAWKVLYKGGSTLQKGLAVVKGFLKRFYRVLTAYHQYDYIFLHREAAPLGPPVFEWIMAKVLRKKLIFDFDDAIWIPNISESNRLARGVKCFWKIKYLCRWSYKVSAGNRYLARWAGQYNPRIVVNPTCVDVVNRYNKLKSGAPTDKVVIGWTGSHSTLVYLNELVPVLRQLEKEHDFVFRVICDQPPAFELASMEFVRWNAVSEIDDLVQIDIGVMPLVNDAWSEGKCGFKLIQYLSLGIPSVASPVGVNRDIIEEGVNGFLCTTEEQWYHALKTLLEDSDRRKEMGVAGRKKMVAAYSVQANTENFLSLFS